MTRRGVIQKRIKDLEKKYKDVKNLRDVVSGEFGSALPIASMEEEEKMILRHIERLKKLLAMPEVDKDTG